jgi:dTDP-D-glucose 4,6-dehydratase
VRAILDEGPFDFVFHFAAEAEVGRAQRDPLKAFDSNVKATYVLYDALTKHAEGLRGLIHASTDKIYGRQLDQRGRYTLGHSMQPTSIYESSKACGDLIAQTFARDPYSLPMTITRFCNIYGPHQTNFTALIPHVMMVGAPGAPLEPLATDYSMAPPDEIPFQAMSDEACASRILGRAPVSFTEGLSNTITWLRQYLTEGA